MLFLKEILKTPENFFAYSIFKDLRGQAQLKIKDLQSSQEFSERVRLLTIFLSCTEKLRSGTGSVEQNGHPCPFCPRQRATDVCPE